MYYKKVNASGDVLYLMTYDSTPSITDPLTVEITKEEYDSILEAITANQGTDDTQQISDEEALQIIMGGDA